MRLNSQLRRFVNGGVLKFQLSLISRPLRATTSSCNRRDGMIVIEALIIVIAMESLPAVP